MPPSENTSEKKQGQERGAPFGPQQASVIPQIPTGPSHTPSTMPWSAVSTIWPLLLMRPGRHRGGKRL